MGGHWRRLAPSATIQPRDGALGGARKERKMSDAGLDAAIAAAAQLIAAADGLVIAAGAGMGVDSGLPDFRGTQGFWKAYPALGRRGMRFETIACPARFAADPPLAWGFYGHRLNLYRATTPHRGFALLQALAAATTHGAFVFTSNVDGQFQKAGFPAARICEVHGSIHQLQCCAACAGAIWDADGFQPVVDAEECRLLSPPPRCPQCGGIARPNILMFGDGGWIATRSERQERRLEAWLRQVERPVAIELGAGTMIATVRAFSERFAPALIRINPVDAQPPRQGGVGVALDALDAIERIAAARRG
jgi:NAD-dependent SIR2 family protein deacetylase